MSKRLQVILSDTEFRDLKRASVSRRKTIAQFVRESISQSLVEGEAISPEKKLNALLKLARHEGPTGDIEQILEEIERGRRL